MQAGCGDKTLSRAGNSWRAWLVFLGVIGTALVADMTLKEFAFQTVAGQPVTWAASQPGHALIPNHEGVTLIPKVLALRLTTNRGAVFGLGQGGRWAFVGISVVAIGVIVWMFWRSRARARGLHAALGLILAGAVSNLYDRLVFGAVRDMLHFFPNVQLPLGLRWPGGSSQLYPWISNLADVWLILGVAMTFWLAWRGDHLREQLDRDEPTTPGRRHEMSTSKQEA